MDSLETVNQKTQKAYNKAAQKYHDLFKDEMKNKKFDRDLLDEFSKRFDSSSKLMDAGCGPSGHIGKYLFNKGINVIGVDISEECVRIAREYSPEIKFETGDIGDLKYPDKYFDGVISFYSIIDTPKIYVQKIFNELARVLKPDGILLIVVKAGNTEGYLNELLEIKTEIYFSLFTETEIKDYFELANFDIEYFETRNPYDFEIDNKRIYSIGKKRI